MPVGKGFFNLVEKKHNESQKALSEARKRKRKKKSKKNLSNRKK